MDRTRKITINLHPDRVREIRLERSFDLVPVGLHILSKEGIILRVNSTEAKMLGYPKRELVGRSFLDFIDPEQREEAWQRFQQKLRGIKVPKKVDRTYLRKDRRHIFVTSEDRLLKNERKEKRVLTALIDITELRELQEQLSELERSELLRSLAAGYSHEFNNLLQVISAAVRLISNRLKALGLSDPVADEMLPIIADSCRKGAELNRRILCYARKTTEQVPEAKFDLNEAVSEAATFFEKTLNNKGIAVGRSLEKGVITGNPGEIHSAVLNLLLNARDAILPDRQGEIRIGVKGVTLQKGLRVEGGRVLRPGKYVKLSISDNGSGIPKEIRKKIFEPFFSTKYPAADNSGLGLAVVLGIVTRHKGGITLESQEGKGTTFHLYFPAS